MADNTKIQWCDRTFNPWIGCTKVSDGCKFCYAETLMDKRYGRVEWGPQGTRSRTSEANWCKPVAWNNHRWEECEVCDWRGPQDAVVTGGACGFCPVCDSHALIDARQRVFCASLADVFEDREELRPWRRDLFKLIFHTPNLDWLILTKRPENVNEMVQESWRVFPDVFPPNVWIGTSIEDQKTADERIPHLLEVPAAIRFLSCEPLLASVDLDLMCWDCDALGQIHREEGPHLTDAGEGIHWVIVGGESGPHARPFAMEWAKSIIDQCRVAGVACFVKQVGSNPIYAGDKVHWLKDRKGGDMSEWPTELQVREFPKV